MKWSDLAQTIGKVAPTIGSLLGGSVGASVGGLISTALGVDNTPSAVSVALMNDPQTMIKIKELENSHEERLKEIQLEENRLDAQQATQAISDVNKTMQAEAASEHWPTYSWRPFNGFLYGITIFGCYVVLPLAHIPVPEIPTEVWMGWSAILGVASYFRGKAQADPSIVTNNKG